MIASVQIANAARAFPNAVPVPSEGSDTSNSPNFQSVLRQYHSPAEQDTGDGSTQQNNQQSGQDSFPARTPGGEPQNAATASNADAKSALVIAQNPGTDTTATSGASASANFRVMLHRVRATRGPDFEASDVPAGGQVKTTDLNQTVPVPLLTTHIVEPARVILPLTSSITLRKDGNSFQDSSAVAQETPSAPETEQTIAFAPPRVRADEAATDPAGMVAFAARLSPDVETNPPVSGALRNGEQTSSSEAAQTAARQVAAGARESTDTRSGEGGDPPSRQNASELFAKPEAVSAQTLAPEFAATPGSSYGGNNAGSDTPSIPMSPTARMDRIIEPPAAPTNTNHDITIRIPDATEQGTAVRFVERGGEVHVSVRTGDAEMAQTLRGGLNDLANRLQDGGLRAEVWQPGSDASSSHDDRHHPFANPDGSNGNSQSSGSHSEQESQKQNKPRWVEELESSIGNENIKETTQLLWQA
jgi:hypothetical protein